jgi:serine/threonine protein kinase
MMKKDFPEFPEYVVKKKLGEGGMASVYLAVQEKLHREVAIKVLDPLLLKDKQILKRFKKEAQTAVKLSNPYIITIYDVGQEGDSHYIVMEYLGKSLRDRIKSGGKLPPQEALDIIKKIAEALSYAHGKGIIHRDIKPDNIMFRPGRKEPVLVDFGIARVLDLNTKLTMTGIRVGTPHYMSPEQCKGEKIDGRSDIYSLGVVLIELLTGSVPYKSETPMGLIYLHTQGPTPTMPEALNNYQPLIDAMMAKEKEARLKDGADVIKQIKLLETEEKPGEYEDDNFALQYMQSSDKSKSKRLLIWTPLILLLLGAMIYFLIGPSQTEKAVLPAENEKVVSPARVNQQTGEVKEQLPLKPPSPLLDQQKTTRDLQTEEKMKTKKSEQKTSKTINNKKQTDQPIKPNKKKEDESLIKEVKEKQEDLLKKEPEKIEAEKINIKTVNFVNLPREVIAVMSQKIKRIEISNLEQGIIVGGEIQLNLSVNENGHIEIKQLDDTRLRVNREDKKEMVKELILKKIKQISFKPFKDETGEPRQIENWRKEYKLGTFRGIIILY